ncbi:MAG: diguanylate cyclase [Lyngbya sp. HA4199-MV5]|jgi:diguanylate cyclase (GGDEF)-like protein|nr:diguanylate cyclase [Lyngbya sp. HA4199-MV5]
MTDLDVHRIKVLLVEDNEDDFLVTRELLADVREFRYEVEWASTYEAALIAIAQQKHDIYLLDYHLGVHNGLEVLQEAVTSGCNAPIILLTGTAPRQVDIEAMRLGATDFLCKDEISTELLERALRYAIRQKTSEEALRQQVERERLTTQIAQQIHQSLELDEILDTTVTEIQQSLNADRVLIYRFEPDWSSTVIAEAVTNNWQPLLGMAITDTYFTTAQRQTYQQGIVNAIANVQTAGFSECHRDLLTQLQVRAKLIVPILLNESLRNRSREARGAGEVGEAGETGEAEGRGQEAEGEPLLTTNNQKLKTATPHPTPHTPHLWGLLVVHQCNAPRQWQPIEVNLLQQLATQVAIAIQQSAFYQQLQTANQKLQRLVALDELTHIPNRRCFAAHLEQEWRRLAREQQCLSLIFCDIDNFKRYNDTYGHVAGDTCLHQIAQAIDETSRRPADLTARYGGEEFAVILPNTNSAGAVKVVEKIRRAIRALNLPHHTSSVSEQVTLSFGIASMVPLCTESPIVLIHQADQALYQAKAEGRDTYHISQSRESSRDKVFK